MDALHHTQGNFKDSPNFDHHKTLYTFKSIREVCEGEAKVAKEE
jgi:hypothetical protein